MDASKAPPKVKGEKHIKGALITLFVFLLTVSAYLLWLFTVIENDNQKKNIHGDSSAVADDMNRHYFLYYSQMAAAISANPAIKGFFNGRMSEKDALIALETIRETSSASIVYLTDLKGNVKVSTVYGNNQSLKGNNYRFRPYFKKAAAGENAVYCAVGVTTGERGVYFSAPVRSEKKIYGVVVIKAPISKVQAILAQSGKGTLLLSDDGIVFDATEPRWIYKSLYRLSSETIKNIIDEQQYAGVSINEIGWSFYEDYVVINGIRNHFDISPVGEFGWDIVMYEPEAVFAPVTKGQWSVIIISGILVLALFSGYMAVMANVRKRRQAERHIVENERHLRNILGTTNEGFWFVNNNGITLDVNPAMCRMLGVSREEVLGEPIFRFLKAEISLMVREEMDRAGKPKDRSVEGVLIRKDGSHIFCIVNMTPVFRDDGTSAGTFAMVTDVTEMKSKENEILQSERNYREIFNSVSDAIIIFDINDFSIVDMNDRLVTLLGYSREEAMKLPLSRLSFGNHQGMFAYMSGAITGDQKVFDWKLRKKDASPIWTEMILKRVCVSGYDRLIMVIRDIEERKRSEQVLKYRMEFENLIAQISRDFINLPYDRIDDGIERALMDVAMFANCTGGAVFVLDEKMDKIFLSHEWHENQADSMKAIFSVVDAEALPYFTATLLKEKKPLIASVPSDLPEHAVNERGLLEKYSMKPFIYLPLIKEEKPYGTMGFFGDELRNSRWDDELLVLLKIVGEAIVNAIERKKYERALSETLNKLSVSNRELEAFAYVASHDLKEPLRMISSYVRLLEKRYSEVLDSNARDFISYAVSGAERMNRLIDDLLAYSRVDRLGGEFRVFNLREAVDEAIHYLDFRIKESGAIVEIAEWLPDINADSVQMVQLFQNLIDNALKYRAFEPPVIRIKAERISASSVKISVEDNGIGIDPQYSEKIFIIFQQLHSKDKYPGTGIGLALCKKIVERHGGKIWVEPAGSRGSIFSFTIPEVLK